MKLFSKVTTLLMVLLLAGGVAWAATYQDHVSVAANGKGDVLIYPFYLATDGGYQTKIQVINTSDAMSAVAKVVVRSSAYSQECLDFLIFLSPTDMWEGYLRWDGEVVMYTIDDSMLTSTTPTFASPDEDISVPVQEPGCGDTCQFGYVEVFLAWVFPNLNEIPTAKDVIYNAYVGTGNINAPVPASGSAPGLFPGMANILAGNQQLQNSVDGWSTALNATTLKDYDNLAALNPRVETIFGQGARNSMDEVEAALNKDWIGMPYINNAEGNTIHAFTFPTKLTTLDANCNVINVWGNYTGFDLGGAEGDEVVYSVRPMDMTERTIRPGQPIFSPQPPGTTFSFPFEVNLLIPDSFAAGWYRYNFTEGGTIGTTWDSLFGLPGDYLRYTGAPVIPTTYNIGAGGFSAMYGVWTDGDVFGSDNGTDAGNEVWLEGYQFSRNTPAS